jgi:hypothetical protein
VEQPVLNPAQATGGKIVFYLRAAEGLDLATFFSRWARAHERALDISPLAAASVRRCVHNHQLPQFNEILAYFGGSTIPVYEGVSCLWFDDISSASAFREYEKALLAINSEADATFYQPEKSFFLYTTEVPIYQRWD